MFLPADVLLEAWVAPDDLISPEFGEGEGGPERAATLIEAVLSYADRHRTAFHAATKALPATLVPAFAAAEARGVTERAIKRMGRDALRVPPEPSALRDQHAIMTTHRLFDGGARPGLLGRLRERFGG